MRQKTSYLIYLVLAVVLGVIWIWQIVEHRRVNHSARAALIKRAEDISNTLSVVIRSQRRFVFVTQNRMESALSELVKSEELISVALINAEGEIVAASGDPIHHLNLNAAFSGDQHWGRDRVTLVNLIDLGQASPVDPDSASPTIVIPDSEMENRERGRDRDRDRDREDRRRMFRRPPPDGSDPEARAAERLSPGGPPPQEFEGREGGPDSGDDSEDSDRRRGFRRRGEPRLGRPPWMDKEKYEEIIKKQGLHGFVIVMSTASHQAGSSRDFWLRSVVALFALFAVAGFAFAFKNLQHSSELQLRLLRAREMNDQLRQMNFAAAGLAHETRNPLNLIRGFAQLIAKNAETTPEVRQRSEDMIEEVDRVTVQLNEFINFSRPREVTNAPVRIQAVARDVARTLESDFEEQSIAFAVEGDNLTVKADEKLLRQVLFNLMMNAVQAVDSNGRIQLSILRDRNGKARIEVRDNGPGVPEKHRREVFRPYFTTREGGTGLGLAIVNQIVLAHGWEISCFDGEPKGAVFCITGMECLGSE